jgi:hypothetical protein
MALTLAEAAKLSNDVLLMGVIETIIYDSPVLQVLPFIEIVGNGLTYNQERTPAPLCLLSISDMGHFLNRTLWSRQRGGVAP